MNRARCATHTTCWRSQGESTIRRVERSHYLALDLQQIDRPFDDPDSVFEIKDGLRYCWSRKRVGGRDVRHRPALRETTMANRTRMISRRGRVDELDRFCDRVAVIVAGTAWREFTLGDPLMRMNKRRRWSFATVLVGLTVATATAITAHAAQGYVQTNLISNISGLAANTDPSLQNPWGIAFFPGQSPFWVNNNGAGTSALYFATGFRIRFRS